eukprot:scaffold26048_cov39-Phaeocystis_antarctica.AAC.1
MPTVSSGASPTRPEAVIRARTPPSGYRRAEGGRTRRLASEETRATVANASPTTSENWLRADFSAVL